VLSETRTADEVRELRARYVNYNDGFREVIRYANKRVRDGELVIVVATGDLVDYFKDRLPTAFRGGTNITPDVTKNNVQVLRDLITARDGRGEALLCPIFMVLGNHDYLIPEPPLMYTLKKKVKPLTVLIPDPRAY